jgi:hypothetical protein
MKKIKKKTEERMFKTLAKILDKDKLMKLESQLIYQEPNGTYALFGEYTIVQRKQGYVLEKTHTHTVLTFVELRNAVTWATLDKLNKVIESNKVLELDLRLSGASENMKVHDLLCKSTKDLDKKTVYLNKLNEDRLKKRRILSELDDFVAKAKAWQYKQFENNPIK